MSAHWSSRSRSACLPALAHAQVQSGSYTGDGTDNRAITGLGFQPDVVIVKTDGQVAVIRTSTMASDLSKEMTGATTAAANQVQSLGSDGFTVGTDAAVNGNGNPYHWMAFKARSGVLKVGSYTGNGSGGTWDHGRRLLARVRDCPGRDEQGRGVAIVPVDFDVPVRQHDRRHRA